MNLSYKRTLDRREFLYKSRDVLLHYRTFLHRYQDYIRGFTDNYAVEPLATQAYYQRLALSQHHNLNQPLEFENIPQPSIEYSMHPSQILQ